MVYTATDIVIDNPPDSAGGNYEMVSGGKMCNGVKCLKTINICWLLSMKESLVFKYRIFLTKSLNEFHLSVQVLITKGSQGLFVFCFVFLFFFTGAPVCTAQWVFFMYYKPAEGKASSKSQRSRRGEYKS